ncbi:MAG: hypothetical protein IV092_24010, partial [Burkholderiaceae bacterium]|nr:hypothetical protein [Burkholderiaceae bacterium]
MSHTPRDEATRKRVWRITANAPQGEYLDRDEAARRDRQALQADAGWQQSSFD